MKEQILSLLEKPVLHICPNCRSAYISSISNCPYCVKPASQLLEGVKYNHLPTNTPQGDIVE